MTDTRYVTQPETNKLIRAALRDAFPGVKFAVRGSGGNATRITWTDGPNEKAVDAVVGRFEGKSFDGMQDLESPRFEIEDGVRVHYGCSYIFTSRDYSDEITEEARDEVAAAGIDPHGLNTVGEPYALAERFPSVWGAIGRGYPADGPLLVRWISADLADSRYGRPASANGEAVS